MKPLNYVLLASLIKALFLIFIFHQDAISTSSPDIDGFLDCLPTRSNPSNPISEGIYTQKNPSFSSVFNAYVRNLRFNTSSSPKPLAIIAAKHKSHVQATIICAKVHRLQLRIRSGGHDYEGLSYVSPDPFIILDMFNLRSIDIDPRSETAWLQSGATVGELYYNIANKSSTLAFPAGVCLTLGVGGHFSGAGYGNMLRKFGLTVDNVVDAEVVDVNGKILTRKTMGEDLFWAINGGGGASFGVVLAWKIKLVKVPPIVTTFDVQKTLEQGASNILYEWQNIAPKIDVNLFIRAQLRVTNKTLQVSFIGLYLGEAKSLVELVNKEFPQLGLNQSDCHEVRWILSTLFFYGLPINNASIETLLQREPPITVTYDKHKSDYVKNPIPKLGLDSLFSKMIEVENVSVQFNPYGGKMSDIPETATPFPHRRGNLFKIQYLAYWKEGEPEIIDRNVGAVREVYSVMTPYVSKNPREAYLNYRDIDIGTNANKCLGFAFDFFKGNVKRLLQVKAKVDPDNFFRYEQSIPVLARKESRKSI